MCPMKPVNEPRRTYQTVPKHHYNRGPLLALFVVSLGITQLFAYPHDHPVDPKILLREQAIMTLHQLLSEVKAYDQARLRIRAEAQIAELLWADEPQVARETVKEAFSETAGEEMQQSDRSKLRSEVLRVVRKHDPDLAESLIANMDDKKTGAPEKSPPGSMGEITERGALSLDAAFQLLEAGDLDRAISSATSSLDQGRSEVFLWFLRQLRLHNPSQADQLFLGAVSWMSQSSADPNDVLFLGLYLLPGTQTSAGFLNDQLIVGLRTDYRAAANAPLGLIRPYLQAASQVFLRCVINPQDSDPAAGSGLALLKAYAIQQLFPLFEQFLPMQVPVLRAELASLNPSPLATTASMSAFQDTGPSSFFPPDLSVSEEVNKIEEVQDPGKRANLLFSRIVAAMNRADFGRARELASRIASDKLRQDLLDLIAFTQSTRATSIGELCKAEAVVGAINSKEVRAVSYSLLARGWLKRGEKAQARRINDLGSAVAAGIDNCSLRAKVYIQLASVDADMDDSRSFDLIGSAINDSNMCNDSNLSTSQIPFVLGSPSGAWTRAQSLADANLDAVISQLAKADFQRTIHLGWSIMADGVRSLALISACRTVLTSQKNRDSHQLPAFDHYK